MPKIWLFFFLLLSSFSLTQQPAQTSLQKPVENLAIFSEKQIREPTKIAFRDLRPAKPISYIDEKGKLRPLENNYYPATNDPTRKIETIPVFQENTRDFKSYLPFTANTKELIEEHIQSKNFTPAEKEKYRREERVKGWGQDKNNIFLSRPPLAISKTELPDFIPLQDVGVQAFDDIIGYSSGYLIAFPFKFPVDAKTFKGYQRNWLQPSNSKIPLLDTILIKDARRAEFLNGNEVYDKYLGEDKDRVYTWDSRIHENPLISRYPKAENYRLLLKDENFPAPIKDFRARKHEYFLEDIF